MYKFSKFSKFISACFSLGILFSGLQTYGMNLDMLGIGRNRNQDDDDIMSIETNETKSSVLDGIKVEIPEKCNYCSQKALRVVLVPNSGDICICGNNNCLKKIFDTFNIKLNTENIHRCDWFKDNMQNFQVAKAKGYENVWPFKVWKIFDEDKLLGEDFLLCGHSICMCTKCRGHLGNEIVCPACKASYILGDTIIVLPIVNMKNANDETRLKIVKLLSERLKNEWKNVIVLSDKSCNVDKIASDMSWCFINRYNGFTVSTFREGRFNTVDDGLASGEKILVFDVTTNCEDAIKFLPRNKLDDYIKDDYIKSLKKPEKDKRIIYPTSGELYDKIQAAIRMSDNKK